MQTNANRERTKVKRKERKIEIVIIRIVARFGWHLAIMQKKLHFSR